MIARRASRIEQNGFVLMLALITLLLLAIVLPFAKAILWAALAAIVFQPLYRFFFAQLNGHANLAAATTLIVITFAVLLPAFLVGSAIFQQAVDLVTAFQEGEIDVTLWFARLMAALPMSWQDALAREGFGNLTAVQLRAQEVIERSLGAIASQLLAIGGSVFGYVLAFGVGLYVSYFLLRDGQAVGEAVLRHLPMEREIADRLGDRFLTIVRATLKGTVVVGVAQGTLGAVTFAIVGIPSPLLFGLLMGIASLLPAIGPALIWVPAAIYLLATGAIWEGLLVIGSGAFVIGMIDNLLRPILVGRDTGIPDWLILVTTLGGIVLFGLSGVVIGPLVVGLFLAGWEIMRQQRDTGLTARPAAEDAQAVSAGPVADSGTRTEEAGQ